jgi:2',3'-cyclic-nucleotide 2'-phosphodiesterase (5'-nucleotidase family)
MRRILVLASLLFPALLAAEGSPEQFFRIYYTSSLNGNLDGCECKASPKSGLVKRAAFLRSRARTDSILVDAGDILDVAPDEELARHVFEVYRELGYDAVAVGDQELSNGTAALRQYVADYPLLSNNLSLKAGTSIVPLSPGPLTLRKGKLRVTVISLLDPEVFALYPKQLKAQISITPPAEALAALLAAKPATGDDAAARLTVLVYHGPVEAAAALVAQGTGVDVVIVGHEQRLVHPLKVGGTILASPGEEGNRVGVLTLKFRDGRIAGYSHEFRLFDYSRDLDDSGVRKRIEQYRDALRAKVKGS